MNLNRKLFSLITKTAFVNYQKLVQTSIGTRSIYNYKRGKTGSYVSSLLQTRACFSSDLNNAVAAFEDVKKIETECKKDVLLIDVREPEELKETGVLPLSINIPLGDLEHVLKDISDEDFLEKYGRPKPSKDFPIVFSCRSGKRSGLAQAISQQLGYKNVKNYSGGWLDWEERHQNKD